MQTAVLFLIFNRPNTTARVFQAIREAKPPRLYVAADGPRIDCDGDLERVNQVRKIATSVDWSCEVKTLFRDTNLGCKFSVSSAISWFFEHEEQGIILEDDILVDQRFFHFLESGLVKYKENLRVGTIAGYNLLGSYSYQSFFARYPHIWGWGTWKRVWNSYCVNVYDSSTEIYQTILSHLKSPKVTSELVKISEKIRKESLDTWDFQYGFLQCYNKQLTLYPPGNLVKNIGFSGSATHTKRGVSAPIVKSDSNIVLPETIIVDPNFDDQRFSLEFPNLWEKIYRKIQSISLL